ncbi:MAG: ABC transporter permease [Ruminococcus sp.]|nr:ABC transporter permease [Ruminococcus sp.]
MLFHNIKYNTLASVREKSIIFWLMLFPVILATFFHIALIGVYDKDILFNTIDVAVVEKTENPNFRKIMDSLSEGDDKMFNTTYADEEKALKMLDDGDVKGIIYVDPKLSLSVKAEGLDQTIIKSFIDQYSVTESVIIENALKDPGSIGDVSAAFSEELKANEQLKLSDGNMNTYMTYMYNLIAMVCILGTTVGTDIARRNEANLSSLGIRSCVSPTGKLTKNFAGLISGCIVQSVCTLIAAVYIVFVLRDDLGIPFPMVVLTSVVGSWMGVAIGFFFGTVGKFSEGSREGLSIAFSMVLCFLSGLMVGDIKTVMMEKVPWFNNINPAALVCDALYALNVDGNLDRYLVKMLTMAAVTLIFTLLGFIMTRRKKYASI